VRLRLDLLLTFSANPEDYTARGKIITPLKDRIGSEIRTHYPRSRRDAMTITEHEAWTDRRASPGALPVIVPPFVREVVEEIAFHARGDQKVDKRSGVSQRLPITALETVVSNAERRALMNGEPLIVPRVSDVYASVPSLTGKIELEYEGELKGGEQVARDLVRQAVATVFDGYSAQADTRPVVDWFERGGTVNLSDMSCADDLLAATKPIAGLPAVVTALGGSAGDATPLQASVADFVLEGLCAVKKISRSEEGRLFVTPAPGKTRNEPRDHDLDQLLEDAEPSGKGKKKYYN
jgi:magnesium chelatase subunit I